MAEEEVLTGFRAAGASSPRARCGRIGIVAAR
jgi:hypothetical protein